MCGRSCLSLEPHEILCACKYEPTKRCWCFGVSKFESSSKNTNCCGCFKNSLNESVKNTNQIDLSDKSIKSNENTLLIPEWRTEFNFGLNFKPSYNIAPSEITPVLVSTDHFNDIQNDDVQKRVVVPMLWGMIPIWHKGDYRKHGLKTNNCRVESLLESKLFSPPFRRGQRCVILCEGFYEWEEPKLNSRSVYLIHIRQLEGVKIYDKTTWTPNNVRLMKIAGIFDIWADGKGDKLYSYSVITTPANKQMSWLQDRMPAVLWTEEQVDDWLNFNKITIKQALNVLQGPNELQWHEVSNLVNNSRHKSSDCNKPITKPVLSKTMSSWLCGGNQLKPDNGINQIEDIKPEISLTIPEKRLKRKNSDFNTSTSSENEKKLKLNVSKYNAKVEEYDITSVTTFSNEEEDLIQENATSSSGSVFSSKPFPLKKRFCVNSNDGLMRMDHDFDTEHNSPSTRQSSTECSTIYGVPQTINDQINDDKMLTSSNNESLEFKEDTTLDAPQSIQQQSNTDSTYTSDSEMSKRNII